ncbi:MAG: phosphoenolpyruvate synthase [Deltaproteobacteria bacterium]|nr:phosphoenolpyruvate synthase [Deltaproteobacteria bacterium]
MEDPYVVWFEDLSSEDVSKVGGKNASLGEMIGTLKDEGIRVPDGFATTAEAYQEFLEQAGIKDAIQQSLTEYRDEQKPLGQVGRTIRGRFLNVSFPEEIEKAIKAAYHQLCDRYDTEQVDVAVRSSATAEDLPDASFAGQQETFLNVTGTHELLDACRKCYASLFTDRAISYREEKGFDHMKVALSIGVQKMVRSDLSGSGVMFSIDTETGFPHVAVINAAWGLGETVVQGMVNPDEYRIFKPLLHKDSFRPIIEKTLGEKEKKMVYATGGTKTTKTIQTPKTEVRRYVLEDPEILQLAKWAARIEDHYQMPMDMEWAKDGETGELFIVQARPETVQSQKESSLLKTYTLEEEGEKLLTGLSIGEAIAAGKVCRIKSAEQINEFEDGAILVTEMTDPDWVPVMKKAVGIITDHGGRTCHAAIVSRELGIPAIVGTGEATDVLETGQEVTLSCAEGDEGFVYEGILKYEEAEVNIEDVPETRTRVMMNIASPAAAFRWWRLPCDGIGLARMEFIINNIIKIHPMALIHLDRLKDQEARKTIRKMTALFEDKTEYFVEHLARGIAKIAASQYPEPVIVRMSDFKTNEYADLIGGKEFEPHESNPMLGFRGASRYYSDQYREGFALECKAILRVREEMGLENVLIMIPFCRTLQEADRVLEVLGENGLARGKNGLEVYVMCEIPSNVTLAEKFAERFDGFSIGSNDLTQLILGVDRDSSELADIFDERNEAVKQEISRLLQSARKTNSKVGICGQAPSDYPDFAAFLVQEGIDSISLNPDSVIPVKKRIAEVESSL